VRRRKYLSGALRKKIWEKYGGVCQRCGCETALFGHTVSPFLEKKPCAIDHKVPFSRGGACIESNFQLLCITCNSQKGARCGI
jgi:5-methylcytosine-specific restriction endonuclease McrA